MGFGHPMLCLWSKVCPGTPHLSDSSSRQEAELYGFNWRFVHSTRHFQHRTLTRARRRSYVRRRDAPSTGHELLKTDDSGTHDSVRPVVYKQPVLQRGSSFTTGDVKVSTGGWLPEVALSRFAYDARYLQMGVLYMRTPTSIASQPK